MKYKDNPRLYHIWNDMLRRCYKPIGGWVKQYAGIKVCDEWHDVGSFIEWAMENGYSEELTIDRVDSKGNYEPSNCRWATMKEQQRNKSTNKILTFNGESKCLVEWAEELGINSRTLSKRLTRGWSVERALSETGDTRFDNPLTKNRLKDEKGRFI